MAAPSVPSTVHVKQDGQGVYVRWRAVPTATSYKVYADDFTPPTTLRDTVSSINTDGYFLSIIANQSGPCYVAVTAINAGAEESAKSTAIRKDVFTSGEPG